MRIDQVQGFVSWPTECSTYLTRLISSSPRVAVSIQPNRASIVASFQEHSSLVIELNRNRDGKDVYHQYKNVTLSHNAVMSFRLLTFICKRELV